MNRNLFLYAATVALSVVSTLVMADEAGPTRAQVAGAVLATCANGSLQINDDAVENAVVAPTKVGRDPVVADLAAARSARKGLIGSDANRTYNPFGTDVLRVSNVSRDAVKAETLQAAVDGTLRRTDDGDAGLVARASNAYVAGERFAQRSRRNTAGG